MMQRITLEGISYLLWTDARCTIQPGSSGLKEEHPPALTEEVSGSASLHRYGRSAQLLHLLEIIRQDSAQPGIEEWTTLFWRNMTFQTDE